MLVRAAVGQPHNDGQDVPLLPGVGRWGTVTWFFCLSISLLRSSFFGGRSPIPSLPSSSTLW